MAAAPVRYAENVETPIENEEQVHRDLIDTRCPITETTSNSPAFAAPDAKKLLGSLKPLAATTDKVEWAKKILSAALRGAEAALEAVVGKSAMISTVGGTPITHPPGDSYYSAVPFRYGDYIAKVSDVPVPRNLTDRDAGAVAARHLHSGRRRRREPAVFDRTAAG